MEALRSVIAAARVIGLEIKSSVKGMTSLDRDNQFNALAADLRIQNRILTMPEMKKTIVEKHGARGRGDDEGIP